MFSHTRFTAVAIVISGDDAVCEHDNLNTMIQLIVIWRGRTTMTKQNEITGLPLGRVALFG